MFNKTDWFFTPGKLSIIMDGGAGSSGKGVIGSFVCQHADNWTFACNTFMPQAGHWVKLDDGRSFFYQTLNSCAYQHDKYEKLYIGPGATIELPSLFRELEENGVPRKKLGISPITSILQDIDGKYEKGLCDFDGVENSAMVDKGGYLAKTGTTAHGCGANRARRVLRRKEAKYARDIPELAEFICDVPGEIMGRLDRGESGLLEIAQGFQLSYMLPHFFPFTTSRNCTVAAGLDDMMIPPCYAGNVILNFRTYPIRINSNKYICSKTGEHLTWAQVQLRNDCVELPESDPRHVPKYTTIEGSSGPGYSDQHEMTWEELTKLSGSPDQIMEMTSVTKLPRRVFTFSKKNLEEAIRHNRTNGNIFISLNFVNYVDYAMNGKRADDVKLSTIGCDNSSGKDVIVTDKLYQWLVENIPHDLFHNLRFIGTGPLTDDKITCKY